MIQVRLNNDLGSKAIKMPNKYKLNKAFKISCLCTLS